MCNISRFLPTCIYIYIIYMYFYIIQVIIINILINILIHSLAAVLHTAAKYTDEMVYILKNILSINVVNNVY